MTLRGKRLFRRTVLLWACTLITVVVLRVTHPDVLPDVSAAVATVVTAVIGILATVIAFYFKHREANSHDS